jgi:steroid 5-alpha reductase family enzyme
MKVYKVTYEGWGVRVHYNVLAKTPNQAIDTAYGKMKEEYEKHSQINFLSVDVVASNILVNRMGCTDDG